MDGHDVLNGFFKIVINLSAQCHCTEFIAMATNEVPAASFTFTPRIKTSAGTMRKPPPIPRRPVRTPIAEAVIISMIHEGLAISRSDTLCRHMPIAATNIKPANVSINTRSERCPANREPKRVPRKPSRLKVMPVLISRFFDFTLRNAPESAAAPTITIEDVVAEVGERPITATNPGTARMAPPAPTTPSTVPMIRPRSKPCRINT